MTSPDVRREVALDRNELAVRFAVGAYSNCHLSSEFGSREDIADAAVKMADALLLALTPPAAPASEAAKYEPQAPVIARAGDTIRVTRLKDRNRVWDYVVASVDSRGFAVNQAFRDNSRDEEQYGEYPKDYEIVTKGPLWPVEPSPEAAKYVPKVGDVVALTCNTRGGPLPYRDSLGAHLYRVVKLAERSEDFHECERIDGRDALSPCFINASGMRPATPAERKAAGIVEPSPEATRPTWVRVTRDMFGYFTVGKAYPVIRWGGSVPYVYDTDGNVTAITASDWELCPPPAPVEPAKGRDALSECADALDALLGETIDAAGVLQYTTFATRVRARAAVRNARAALDGSAS